MLFFFSGGSKKNSYEVSKLGEGEGGQGCRRPARGPACQPGLTGPPGRPDYKR